MAWRFNIYAHNPLSRNFIYIDAITGDILEKTPIIHNTNTPGNATTKYSGTQAIISDSFTGGFRLEETRNNVLIETLNMAGKGASYSSAVDFTSAVANWTFPNSSPFDNAALDAHWGAEMVLDYWKTQHSRSGLDGGGAPLFNFVHADLHAINSVFLNNDNAFWDGQKMTYGDGSVICSPLTSLDVVAHETGHGIDQFTANLKESGESGALNEGLSDIWAAVIEHWAAPLKNTWEIGEDITVLSPYYLRSMSNPNSSFLVQPDTYQGTYWVSTVDQGSSNDNGGVHTNMGVLDFWFYLLTQGGNGVNDNGNCYNVTSLGLDIATQIVWQTEQMELPQPGPANPQMISFSAFRNATVNAASHLTALTASQRAQVENAWRAVGVGNPYLLSISTQNSTPLCSTNTFVLDATNTGVSVNWTSGYTGGATINSTTGVVTRVNNYSGQVTISANLTGCNTIVNTLSKTIWVGPPVSPQITGPAQLNPNTANVTYAATVLGTAYQFSDEGVTNLNTQFLWTFPMTHTGWSIAQSTTNIPQVSSGTASTTLRVVATNSCGNSAPRDQQIIVTCQSNCSQPFIVFPNPAGSVMNVTTDSPGTGSGDVVASEVILTDVNGLISYRLKGNTSKSIQIPVSEIKNGDYFLSVLIDGQIIKQHVIIQH